MYETKKYGELSRRLELGKGTPTPFREKVDKLVRSLSVELKRSPRVVIFNYIEGDLDAEYLRKRIHRRYSFLSSLIKKETLDEFKKDKFEVAQLFGECSSVCELIEQSGAHHFVSVLVRNARNVSEAFNIEIYYDPVSIITLVSDYIKKQLKSQAEQSGVWLEDVDDFNIAHLPTLPDLLKIIGISTLEEMFKEMDEVTSWRIGSVQYAISKPNNKKVTETAATVTKELADVDEKQEWLKRYDAGDEAGAIDILNELITKASQTNDYQRLARFYNDRGYIKSSAKVKNFEEGIKDLEKAIAYHYKQLELTLVNLGVANIDIARFESAVKNLNDALFLAVSREQILASHLKMRLTSHSSTPIFRIEQRPANVVEASYINLAFVLNETRNPNGAIEILDEAQSLMPKSFRVKHAKARLLLSMKQANIADQLYSELDEMEITDDIIAKEVKSYVSKYLKNKRKFTRKGN